MALSAAALTTLATVKDELDISGTSSDGKLERLINAVSDAFATEATRVFQYDAAIVEKVKGHGTERILVSRSPLKAITAIALLDQDGTVADTYDSDTYEIESEDGGIIYRATGWVWSAQTSHATGINVRKLPGTERRSIRVTYGAGWITPEQAGTRDLPYDIEEAVIRQVVHLWKTRNDAAGASGAAIVSEKLGDYAVAYAAPDGTAWGGGGTAILLPAVAAVARRYRRFV